MTEQTDAIIAKIKAQTDGELLADIYWNRGSVSELQFYDIERRLGLTHNDELNRRYEPSTERDPDTLMQEIKRMQGTQVSMQAQMGKILKELKDKR